jgi:hypothetical protein
MTQLRFPPASAGFLVLGAACAGPSSNVEPTAPPPAVAASAVDTVFVVDTVTVDVRTESRSDLDEMEDQIARLQIQLLERDVHVSELAARLDATRREVVRSMSRRQTSPGRAEAASAMAEAEIAVEALGRSPGASEVPGLVEARARLVESTEAFGAENFGGAVYLAEAARMLARTGQGRLAHATKTLQSDESLFALPVPLQTVGRSNVRSGPGLDFDVAFTLGGGAELEGRSHTSRWVRVLDAEGREGWIFHTLVTAR